MTPENNINEQNRKLKQMDYNPNEDIFRKEKHISLDGDGNPILDEDLDEDKLDKGLDIPGADEDDDMEEIGRKMKKTTIGVSAITRTITKKKMMMS